MIERQLGVVLVAIVSVVPATASSQSAKGLLGKMLEVDSKRSKGVADYAMDITMMGHDTTLFYERVSVQGAGGKPVETFRVVSFEEMKKRQEAGQGMSPDAWQAYSDALRQTGSAMSSETEKGMNEAGLPPGMLGAMGSDPTGAGAEPWASPDPRTMMNSMADFAAAAGDAPSKDKTNAGEAGMAKSMLLFKKRAKIVGKESVGKSRAIHVRADKLNVVQEVNGEQVTFNAISLWVDPEKYVPLKLRIDGSAVQEGKPRDVFIERLDQDYRTVPDSKLYMPYRSVLRMHGVLGRKEQKQMEDARRQVADLEKQLAEMSPQERAMVESMVGPQIEMLRKMVNSGEMEVVTTVRAVRVNTGLSGAFASARPSQPMRPTASTAQPASSDSLVQSIQRDLTALGYDPGNTQGELSTATVVAISKFQAENGLEVTGEATPQLAGILSAKRDAAASSTANGDRNAQSLEDAQAACLQRKIDAAKKTKKAFGRVMGAAAGTVLRYGGSKAAGEVEKASQEAYKADATAKDVEEAAKALGISKDDVESCRSPNE